MWSISGTSGTNSQKSSPIFHSFWDRLCSVLPLYHFYSISMYINTIDWFRSNTTYGSTNNDAQIACNCHGKIKSIGGLILEGEKHIWLSFPLYVTLYGMIRMILFMFFSIIISYSPGMKHYYINEKDII